MQSRRRSDCLPFFAGYAVCGIGQNRETSGRGQAGGGPLVIRFRPATWGGCMLRRLLAGFAVAACTTGLLQAPVGAQRGAPAQDPGLPTEKQMAESPEAQTHIAAAMAIAKSDLQDEAKANCTATGPRRPAVIRQMAGLPPEPQV